MALRIKTNLGDEIHKSITTDRILEVLEDHDDEMRGCCVSCGEDAYSVEPDAERYRCESCGVKAVYGAEQLLLHTVA